MIKKLLISAAVIGPLGYYYYNMRDSKGITSKIPNLSEKKIPAKEFVYLQHVGSYAKVDESFKIVSDDFKDLRSKLNNPKLAAIYYDNPTNVPEQASLRGVVGMLFDKSNRELVQEFIRQHPYYDFKELPEITTLSARAPTTMGLNASAWISSVLFSKMRENLPYKATAKPGDKTPLLELYDVENDKVKNIDFHVPYGSSLDQLWLTKAPEFRPHIMGSNAFRT